MSEIRDAIFQALVQFEEDKPRNRQVRLGPSELGGCREYVRNVMIGAPMQDNGGIWPVAAVVGTLVGSHMEAVAEKYIGALTEVPVTTTLPNGLMISGHADIVIVSRNAVVDCKTKDGLDEVLREGSSLDNLIQVSVYTLGLVQAGVLEVGATAHLLYVDRSGNQQFLHETELDWDTIMSYVQLAVDRMDDVLVAQEHIDAGEVEWARALRDKTPPFCYSERVLCPFRDLCWKGSEWVPDEEITDPEIIDMVERYDANRTEGRAVEVIRKDLRERLKGVSGVTPSGLAVTWADSKHGQALYVTRVKGH
jgi:hypothetical protein